jgi:hypothetical protein
VTDTQTRLDAIRDLAGRLHAPATGGNTRPLRTEAADTLLVLVAELERVTARYDVVRHAYAVEAQERWRLEGELERVTAALQAVFTVAAISHEGDPWYCEHEGVDAEAAFALARAALAGARAAQEGDV